MDQDGASFDTWGKSLRVATIARKPIVGNLAKNILKHRAGALNINGCRIPRDDGYQKKCASVVGLESNFNGSCYMGFEGTRENSWSPLGSWPYNLLLVHEESCTRSDEGWTCSLTCPCVAVSKQSEDATQFFWSGYEHELVPLLELLIKPAEGEPTGVVWTTAITEQQAHDWMESLVPGAVVIVLSEDGIEEACILEDVGFEIRDTILIVDGEGVHFIPKASRRERDAGVPPLGYDLRVVRYFLTSQEVDCEVPKQGFELSEVPPDLMEYFEPRETTIPRRHRNYHATVKPQELMERLMDIPPGGKVLEPFLGSGTTAVAAIRKGVSCIGIERDEDEGYIKIADARVKYHATTAVKVDSPVQSSVTVGFLWDDE